MRRVDDQVDLLDLNTVEHRHGVLIELLTILSGDLNSNDGPDFAGNAENAYHVVVIPSGAGPSTERLPGARKVVGSTCSLRAVVNIRQGAPIRSDSDLVEIARRLGVTLSVLQSMGRNARMVVIRENGPPDTCEEALAELRSDLRIESVERH